MLFVLQAVSGELKAAREDIKNLDPEDARLTKLLVLFARAFNSFEAETPDDDVPFGARNQRTDAEPLTEKDTQ
jgi:hypothetical protein